LRKAGPDAPRLVARRFNAIAWGAFGVLIATGIWNVAAEAPWHGRAATTLVVKVLVVAASGAAALVHARATSKAALAAFGALSALTAVAALFLGVLLAS